MKTSSAPVTLNELLRLALPVGTEYVGRAEQQTRVVKWAVVVNLPLSAELDIEADDLVLLSGEPLEASTVSAIELLAHAGVAAVISCGPVPEPVIAMARTLDLPLVILPSSSSLRQAHQSALTLITNRRAQTSLRAAQVRQHLAQLVTEGAGLEALVWAMADLTRKGVIVQDKRLAVSATWAHPALSTDWATVLQTLSDPEHLPHGWSDRRLAASLRHVEHQTLPGGITRVIMPIVVKGIARGYLSLVSSSEEFDVLDELVAEEGAEACALEMAKAKAVSQVTKQLRGEFIDALLAGRTSLKEVEQWAKQLGHDVSMPHAAITFGWDCENPPSLRRLETVLNGELGLGRIPALVRIDAEAGHVGAFILLESASSIKPARDLAGSIYSRAMAEHPKAILRCGIGHPAISSSEWRTSYREAEQALEMAHQLNERQPVYFGDLSVYRLLFKMAEHPDLISFCTETLGALTAYDDQQHSSLLDTLEAFFAHHGNLSQTAEALFIHRNTLQYRLERIAEIAGIDLENPETRLALQLAIKAHRLLNSKGGKEIR